MSIDLEISAKRFCVELNSQFTVLEWLIFFIVRVVRKSAGVLNQPALKMRGIEMCYIRAKHLLKSAQSFSEKRQPAAIKHSFFFLRLRVWSQIKVKSFANLKMKL